LRIKENQKSRTCIIVKNTISSRDKQNLSDIIKISKFYDNFFCIYSKGTKSDISEEILYYINILLLTFLMGNKSTTLNVHIPFISKKDT